MRPRLPLRPRRLAGLAAAPLCLALLLPLGATGAERGLARPPATEGAEAADVARVIVRYRSSSALMQAQSASARRPGPQLAATLGSRLGLALSDGPALGSQTQALRATGLSSSALAARLAAQADVEWVEIDRRRRHSALPNDPYYGGGQTTITPAVGQWYLRAPDATAVSAINAAGAWGLTTGAASVTVAVLDTGVRFDHPDLQSKLYPGYDFISDAATANDGNGRDADASDPGDWQSATDCPGDPYADSSSWHGTQTAGLIGAATDNGIGMASTGRNVMLLPVRVLGRCGGWDSDIIAGMRWAAGLSADPVANPHPAKVLNMSLGSDGSCPASYREVFGELTAAGVTVVVAAGNSTGHAVSTPASCPGAIAVAGIRHAGTKVGYSNLGPEITIAAPAGNCVNTGLSEPCLYPLLTTTNLGATTPGAHGYSDSYNASYGTSFAAPLVAGTVGLMLSLDPTLTPAQVKAALQASARTFPTQGSDASVPVCHAPDGSDQLECICTTATCGAGMLDAAAAVARIAPVLTPRIVLGTASTLVAGGSLVLDGTTSSITGNRSIAGYQWAITGGADIARFSGSTTGSTATLLTSGAGTVTVSLTLTDSAGATASTSTSVTVQAAVTSTPAGISGGGALGWGWLLGLAAAVGVLRRR